MPQSPNSLSEKNIVMSQNNQIGEVASMIGSQSHEVSMTEIPKKTQKQEVSMILFKLLNKKLIPKYNNYLA